MAVSGLPPRESTRFLGPTLRARPITPIGVEHRSSGNFNKELTITPATRETAIDTTVSEAAPGIAVRTGMSPSPRA